LLDACNRLRLTLDISVLVQLLRRRDVRMAEDELRIAGGHAQVLEHRGCRMAGVMQLDVRQPGLTADLVEGADEVLRIDRCAGAAEEDQ